MTRRGLTLLELLAATLILSAASAAGSTVLRNARGVQHDSALQSRALWVMAEYDQSRLAATDEVLPNPWSFSDDTAVRWRVTVTHQALPEDAALDPRFPELEWRIERIDLSERGIAFETVFTRRALVPAPLSLTSTNTEANP